MESNTTVIAEEREGITVTRLSGFSDNIIEGRAVEEEPHTNKQMTETPAIQREAGDQVNRFLLCALVSESAKSIKEEAGKIGETLPMTMIVRGVLRSYRLAAKDINGPLAEPEPDIAGLRVLNEKVLKDQIMHHSRDRVKGIEKRLSHAQRLGDDVRINAEREGLEQAIELRDRLAKKFR
jgi:hypothetical protein